MLLDLLFCCVSASLQAATSDAGEEEEATGGGRGRTLPLLPPRAEVPMRGQSGGRRGAWLLTSSRTLEKLTDVLEERAVEVRTLGLSDDAYLPFAQQKVVQGRLRDRWLESPDGLSWAKEARETKAAKTMEGFKRTLESYYRKSQEEDYGGRLWQHLLGALGALPPRVISIVNEVIAERTEANRAFAASSSSASAPTRGITRGQLPRAQRGHEEGGGVRHTRCKAYELRDKAKKIDRDIEKQNHLWRSPS